MSDRRVVRIGVVLFSRFIMLPMCSQHRLLWATMMIVASSILSAQTDGRLIPRFDDIVVAAVPGARAEPIPSLPGETRRRWHLANGERLEVRYWIRGSPPEAAQFTRQLVSAIPVPNSRIDGIGEEAYLLAPVGIRFERLLIFRRGRVVVETRIPDEQAVKRFAALFAKEVARAIAAGEIEER